MTKRKPDTDQPTALQPKIMKSPKSMKIEAVPADNSSESTKLTQQETQLYDRQIRLWGLDAQQSLRNAKLLVIGVTSFSNELLKNIVLTGVDTITICSTSLVTERNIGAQFLIDKSKIGLNVIRTH